MAGNERQYARGHEREQARRERERDLGLHQASKRASSSSTRRSSSGSRGGRPFAEASAGTGSGRSLLQRRARSPTVTAPAAMPTSGSTHASRLKPRFGGAASTLSPNCATSFASISLLVSPAAIRSRMNV